MPSTETGYITLQSDIIIANKNRVKSKLHAGH